MCREVLSRVSSNENAKKKQRFSRTLLGEEQDLKKYSLYAFNDMVFDGESSTSIYVHWKAAFLTSAYLTISGLTLTLTFDIST